jgi:predicted nucleic acid-binding Zn ribbon protein
MKREELEASMDETQWKQLCHAIMHETDPATLNGLVDRLNQALEHRDTELRRRNSVPVHSRSD